MNKPQLTDSIPVRLSAMQKRPIFMVLLPAGKTTPSTQMHFQTKRAAVKNLEDFNSGTNGVWHKPDIPAIMFEYTAEEAKEAVERGE